MQVRFSLEDYKFKMELKIFHSYSRVSLFSLAHCHEKCTRSKLLDVALQNLGRIE